MPAWRWEEWETAEVAAIREVEEETGLKFIPEKLYQSSKQKNSWEIVHAHRFLWTWEWTIKLQEEEADWYAWYTYQETRNIKLAFDYADVI